MTRRSNAPYTPVYYPDLAEPWRGLLALFLRFCEKLRIPSKDEGMVPLILLASQRYAIEEIFEGFGRGVHDFVLLKARQLGLSTLLWAFDLFWLTRFSLQGMYLADDEGNKELHRDVIGQMYLSLPVSWSRGPWRVNNRFELTWPDRPGWPASRLMWSFANKRNEGQLGRSRGLNYIHAEELDSWTDKNAPASLTATRSSSHPRRAYFWVGTGQGYGLLYEMWDQAEHSHSSKPIFVGFWRRADYVVTRAQTALWAAYGAPSATQEEREWGAEVRRRYGYSVTREQLTWWRWTLAEGKGINGDQAKMLQEFPWLPEHAFQSAGSAFFSAMTCLRTRRSVRKAPSPATYRYEWGAHFDAKDDSELLVPVDKEAATLAVWETPQKGMHYVIAADPAYGSGPRADRFATTVWRAHPDALVQVAEYKTPLGAMYQFAWVLAHLGGFYRVESDDRLILEIGGPGRAVHEELDRMVSYGYGLTKRSDKIQDVLGGIQHFLYARVDSISGQRAWHFNTTAENRIQIFEQLRDAVERGALVVRSAALAEELFALRRDESGRIEAGGIAHDDLAFTAALAVHCWLQNVIPEIEDYVAPLTPERPPGHVGEQMLRGFLRGLRQDESEPLVKTYGVQAKAPGR